MGQGRFMNIPGPFRPQVLSYSPAELFIDNQSVLFVQKDASKIFINALGLPSAWLALDPEGLHLTGARPAGRTALLQKKFRQKRRPPQKHFFCGGLSSFFSGKKSRRHCCRPGTGMRQPKRLCRLEAFFRIYSSNPVGMPFFMSRSPCMPVSTMLMMDCSV